MPISVRKFGATDVGPGTGVEEVALLSGALAASMQGASIVPIGDPWNLHAGASFTPPVVTDTLPPQPVMAYKIPSGKALLFTGGVFRNVAADETFVRVCRRYFLFGYQGTAAPAAPAAPTVALLTVSDGIGTGGIYSYKVAPIDAFRREGLVSAASANVTLTATQRAVTVTPPALGAGVIGYNIYRTIAGGSTWYYIATTSGATAYLDAQPDTDLVANNQTPTNTWVTGAVAGEVADGPCELIAEIGTPVLNAAITHTVYTGPNNETKQVVAQALGNTVGLRIRIKPGSEAANFITTPTAAANLWRGLYGNDSRTRHEEDYGVTAVSGLAPIPTAGSIMFFGQQTIGVVDPLNAIAQQGTHAIPPTNPHGVLLPPLSEIVAEIGNVAAAAVGIREVDLFGLIYPTTGT